MDIREFQPDDEDAVIVLWEQCGLVRPWNDPRKDISRKLKVRPDLFLVGVADGKLVATVIAGYDGHRGWINYVAVAPEERRRGRGRAMIGEAEDRLRIAGCPKVNLQIRHGNADAIAFYASLGYVQDEVVSMGKRLEVDEGATRSSIRQT
jgi:ribosomal protein S18 acetylase RimI-like enzyme